MLQTLLGTVLLLALSTPSVSMAAPERAPQGKARIRVDADYPLPPGGLAGLWDMNSIVLRVQVIGSKNRLVRHSDAITDVEPLVSHRVKVLEVYKPFQGVIPGDIIVVEQVAGVIDDGGYIYEVPEAAFAPLERGRTYVLFLRHKEPDVFRLDFGPSAAYLVENGKVHTQGHSFIKSALEADLLARLRTLQQAPK